MTATFETLMRVDRVVGAASGHTMTPFWQNTARRLYEGDANVLVAACGRGSIC